MGELSKKIKKEIDEAANHYCKANMHLYKEYDYVFNAYVEAATNWAQDVEEKDRLLKEASKWFHDRNVKPDFLDAIDKISKG